MFRQTAIYAPGAGLGASKGKDISKMTEFGGYVGMARDSVSALATSLECRWDLPWGRREIDLNNPNDACAAASRSPYLTCSFMYNLINIYINFLSLYSKRII
jgi:hypothetical protein